MYAVRFFVGGMTGSLVLLQERISKGQNLFDEKLRQRPQNGELAYRPSFAHKIVCDGLIEIDALIEQTIIMGNSMAGLADRGVELIADEQSPNTLFAHSR